jgi:signal transduction histidine kinase
MNGPPDGQPAPLDASPRPPGERLALLLLEDSLLDAELIAERLAHWGPRVALERVSDQASFVEALERRPPDVILSDYNVPGFDGLAALEVARRLAPECPFIVVSGSLGEERAVEVMKRGATDYVLKERLERLVPSIERALRERHERKERQRLEAEARARAEFEQQLIGIVSHDLRTPLQAIQLSASLLLKREDLDPWATKTTARMLAATERAGKLIADLLDFTQARLTGTLPVYPRPEDLHALLRQVVEEFRMAYPERDIQLELEGDGQGTWDPGRTAQVFSNLLANALKYGPDDGTPVRVEARGEPDAVVVSVHNRGEPIAPEVLPRIFEPLQRGRKVDPGERSIGLGLYIVRQLVRAHGGTVQVESSAEEGTCFTVRLPRHGAPAA